MLAARSLPRMAQQMPENILFIRLKSIGDVVLTLPAVHAVRDQFPGAKLHFLVSKENASIVRGFADIDEIIPMDRSSFRSANPLAVGANLFKLVRTLREKKFSRVIDFQGYGETGWLSWLSGAPERWGQVYQPARAWGYTRGVERDMSGHPAEWNLSLLRQCGLKTDPVRNQYVLPSDVVVEADRFFAANKLDGSKPTLFLQPFTSNRIKNWPLEKFLALADHFRSRGMQIVFGGGPSDRPALKPAETAGFVVAAGVPLLVSAALANRSALVLGADTGLLHLAVAMGKPVVMLMQSAAPGKPHPFQHADWALTPAKGTVADIPTHDVIARCESFLLEPKGRR